ncbi:MAG: hypothetical protein JSV78_09010 [Phycisphaerales bacterium]|nr:MAG: hypothetical protein JSV78_09010 [Phycisphaerales bacterium]
MTTGRHDGVELLSQMGLTELEAEIYVFLLQHSPASGYKIAKGIGRSFPSTYKAVASLQAKGAVLVDDGKSRLSRAVPVDELMSHLERRFRQQRSAAVAALDQLPKSPDDTRIYQLTSVDQVYERARRLLAECEERALLELFPEPLAALRGPIEQTAARGVDVTARIYEPAAIDGVRIIRSPYGAQNLQLFKTQWLAVMIDGRQFLLAHLLKGGAGVFSATWSANPAVSRALYDYANSDFHHYAFRPALETAGSVSEIRAEYAKLSDAFPAGGDPGFKDFLEKFSENLPGADDAEEDSQGSG